MYICTCICGRCYATLAVSSRLCPTMQLDANYSMTDCHRSPCIWSETKNKNRKRKHILYML